MQRKVELMMKSYVFCSVLVIIICGLALTSVAVGAETPTTIAGGSPFGNDTRIEYDEAGKMIAAVDALGNRVQYAYNEQGHLSTMNRCQRGYDTV